MERVKEIWQAFHYSKYDAVYDYTEEFGKHIKAAAEKDAERWWKQGYGNKDMEYRVERIHRKLQITEDWLVEQWGEGTGSAVEDVEQTPTGAALYYNLQGMKVEFPVRGQVYIVRQGGKSAKILLQ
jgi:hypothetical protein